jgi:murein DD-endopeptidase MepM/ murein hydrolase activator NlpD
VKRVLIALVSLALLTTAGSPSGARGRYLAPVADADGKVFPVARSNWYSVINFTNDWHAPRMRFIDGKWVQVGIHEGNDVFAEPGTPILSIVGGHVEQMGWTFYSGWRVGVRGDDGKYWFYAHMRRFAPGLSIGTRVRPGTILGEVGNTGYGDVPGHNNEFTYHLHLGIQEPDGSWTDPYPLLKRLYRVAVEPS